MLVMRRLPACAWVSARLLLPLIALVSFACTDVAEAFVCQTALPFGGGDDEAFATAVQSDGKIVVAGFADNGANDDIALGRFNPDCTPDTTFDTDAIVITPVGTGNDQAQSVAIQTDGRIVVAGFTHNGANLDFVVVRYNTDGSLDTGFNGTGIVTTPIGAGDDQGRALAIQTDGRIVVAGYYNAGANLDFAVVRYNTNGSLDAGFNGTGIVTTPIGPGDDRAEAIAIQTDGRIVVTGDASNGTDFDIAAVRYNTNGTLHAGFSGGIVTTPIGAADDFARGVAIQSTGEIVVVGSSHNGADLDFAAVRYNPNGTLDTSFNGSGTRTLAIGPNQDLSYAVGIQTDGKIVAGGFSHDGSNFNFTVVRYNGDGSLDPAFDGDGIVAFDFAMNQDFGYGLALQPDGKIVVVGSANNGSNYDAGLVRYNTDGSRDGTARWYRTLAKRDAPGPFTAAPILQGDWNTSGATATR